MSGPPKGVDFGFDTVSPHEKTKRVKEVFDKVSTRYDRMNDVMSLGIHRVWKRLALSYAQLRPGQSVLDCAAGTGDLTTLLCQKVGPSGMVVMSDINEAMLRCGRDRLIDEGYVSPLRICCVNTEHLAFASGTFDVITLAFGLRNMTDKSQALRECARVLKPGGRLLILEFSKPYSAWLQKVYDAYSFHVIPRLGEWVADDRASYQYLVESIRKHPAQNVLAQMMKDVGFERVKYHHMAGGIVALHLGTVLT